MRPPWASDHTGQTPWHRWWRRTAILVTATAALNAVFWLVVDHAEKTRRHLTITLSGSSVRASVDQHPAAEWDDAPRASGRLGIAISALEFVTEGGIDRIVVKSLPGGTALLRDDFSHGASPWTLPPGWRTRGNRFVTAGRTVLWSQNPVCDDCSVELDLAGVRGLDVFLRATDDKNGLLLRWRGESLAWHTITNGDLSNAHGIVHYTPSQSDLYDRFGAHLASILRRGYLDGWRFVGWYVQAAGPGLLIVLLLAVAWRARHLLPPRLTRGLGKLFAGRRAISLAVGSIVAVAAVASSRYWWPDRVLFAATGLALVSVATGLVVLAVRELMRIRAAKPERYRRLCAGATSLTVLTVCAAAAGYSAFAARVYLEGIPHVQDSTSYLLAAKAIASGHLKVPINPELGPFFELGLFFEYREGFLYPLVPGLYFAGHPALLALGELIHAPWVVNPISSGITLGLLFLLCRELFGVWTGLLAVALGAISPFARFQSASMMTHTSALLFVTAALLSLVYWLRRRRSVYALCMGAALGALLNVRPYEAGVLAVYIGLVLLLRLRRTSRRSAVRMGLVAAAGCTPFVLLVLCQTAALGNVVHPAARDLLRWIPENIDASRERLEELNDQLFGWPAVPDVPAHLTVGVLLLAVLVMRKTWADWFITGWALLYVGAYVTYAWHGNMFGPRYWYPSIGGQLILVARFLQSLPSLVTRLTGLLWAPGKTSRWHWVAMAAGAVPMWMVAAPLFVGTVETFPRVFSRTYGDSYNGFSSAPFRLLAEHGVTRGLVFFTELPYWQHFLTGIAANDMSFAGNLIFARHIEGRDHVLIRARPDHPPYLITWNGSEMELGRLQLDPVSNEVRLLPMPAKHDGPGVIGESNIYVGFGLPRGVGLNGGLATDRRGDLYVVDAVDREVLVFDAGGTLRRRLRVSYDFGPGVINAGHGIAVDADGNAYVANFDPPAVVRLNADGTFGWRAREASNGEQRLTSPVGIAMLPDGNLVVANVDPPGLHVLRRDGTFAGYYAQGAGAELRRPFGVAVGGNGHVYVSDAELKALLEIDEEGRVVHRWSLPLHDVRPFQVPYVTVDPSGHAFVSDFNAWALYHARPDRAEVEVIGPSESVEAPSGITTRDGEVLVIKGGWNKVLRFLVQRKPS